MEGDRGSDYGGAQARMTPVQRGEGGASVKWVELLHTIESHLFCICSLGGCLACLPAAAAGREGRGFVRDSSRGKGGKFLQQIPKRHSTV